MGEMPCSMPASYSKIHPMIAEIISNITGEIIFFFFREKILEIKTKIAKIINEFQSIICVLLGVIMMEPSIYNPVAIITPIRQGFIPFKTICTLLLFIIL